MPFTFDNVVTPQGEKLQCAFADLWVQMISLVNSVPDDGVELMKEKEEWCCSWEHVDRDIKDEGKPQGSKATIVDCKIYAKNPCSLIDPITMICYIMMVTLFLVSGTSMDNCYFQLADKFNHIQHSV
ncbi:hypothetical protein EV424DRAFT_1543427 [Suillus variegatus]|nr:hypothetical protein EV424DRAFT_1543427 [Suillus variegatus]